jgi:hypothetical protein
MLFPTADLRGNKKKKKKYKKKKKKKEKKNGIYPVPCSRAAKLVRRLSFNLAN